MQKGEAECGVATNGWLSAEVACQRTTYAPRASRARLASIRVVSVGDTCASRPSTRRLSTSRTLIALNATLTGSENHSETCPGWLSADRTLPAAGSLRSSSECAYAPCAPTEISVRTRTTRIGAWRRTRAAG